MPCLYPRRKKVNVDNISRQSQLALLVPTSQKIYDAISEFASEFVNEFGKVDKFVSEFVQFDNDEIIT